MSEYKILGDNQEEQRKLTILGSGKYERITANSNTAFDEVAESSKYVEEYKKLVERVLPHIDTREPSTFAFYGSAEKYYENSFKYIQNSYPYDGSRLEKVQWSLSASAIDLAILQHEYPKETGFVNFSPSGWGTVSTTSGKYGLPSTQEYIKFSGGPYVGSVFDASTGRESGLKINPTQGNTLEFWLKKDEFATTKTDSEVIFDSYTIDYAEGNSSYGRFLLEVSSSAGSPFYLTYMSGTTGINRSQIGAGTTAATVADGNWHHYAFVVFHSSSHLYTELYVDGKYDSTKTTSIASMGDVEEYFNGTIGALATTKDSEGGLGYGKLDGSIDELRFWKTRRTAKDVGNYFDFPVHGATDKEQINSILGLYYKFNEGVLSDPSADKIILDYSGRLNNGTFIGYTSSSRDTGSAITLSQDTVTTEKELGDPIINSNSSRVTSALQTLKEIASSHDEYNNSSIFKSVPQWAYEPAAGSNNLDSEFSILLQTVASKFDSIKLLIDGIPRLGFKTYSDFTFAKGSVNYTQNFGTLLGCQSDFDIAFSNLGETDKFSVQNLLSRNFDVLELPIVNKSNLEQYLYNLKFSKTDPTTGLGSFLIDSKSEDIKNKILNSIYVNLDKIYNTKGTLASFRNLIRCFGVDEKLISPNMYGNNEQIPIDNKPFIEPVDINALCLDDKNNQVTLFQSSSTSTEDRHYIQGKNSGPISFETRVIFPEMDLSSVNPTTTNTSVFGLNQTETTHIGIPAANHCGFRVSAVKQSLHHKSAYFTLSSSAGIFDEITTDYYNNVYSNSNWHLSVRFSEDTSVKLSNFNAKDTKKYKVEFSGYHYDLDVLLYSFNLSSSITQTDYSNFIQANKNVFLGAERADITGSLSKKTECKFLNFNVWDDYLENTELKTHAQSYNNNGRLLPMQQVDNNQSDTSLKGDTLVLNWQFENVSYNDADTTLTVTDSTSGSLDDVNKFGAIKGYKYPGTTTAYGNKADIVDKEYLGNITYKEIDNLISRPRVEIKEREVDVFKLDSRPVSYTFSYEKSMYQIISREMLKMLSGVSVFNNLIGEVVNKYRVDYKSLEKLRERFYKQVENDIDFERFVEFYKWMDSSLGGMLEQLQPASSNMNLGIQDVIESHALERNKYAHMLPIFEHKDPKIEGQILGVNELLYDWEHGHHPLSGEQQDNCLWWRDRAERDGILATGNSIVDTQRETLRKRINNISVSGSTYVLRKLIRPYKVAMNKSTLLNMGSNRNANKIEGFYKIVNSNPQKQITLSKNDIYEFKKCDDVINPQKEKLYVAKTDTLGTSGYLDVDAAMAFPFSLYSSSAENRQDFSVFQDGLAVTNNHDDQRPSLQGPFVRENVGGMPHRRVKFGTDKDERPEAYSLSANSSTLTLSRVPLGSPKSQISLGQQAVYNVANIKTDTLSSVKKVGNYDKVYQIVQIAGRKLNNRLLTISSSIPNSPIRDGRIEGTVDYRIPDRPRSEHIFVSRFSSPGGPETHAAAGRDFESGELSIYNTINYRNLSIRDPLNRLHGERSEKLGYRSGSITQASVHMTNRNLFHSVVDNEIDNVATKSDNFYAQHPIPQNDIQYAWITASTITGKTDFVENNLGFGHQHTYSTGSKKALEFTTSKTFQNPVLVQEFIGSGSVADSNPANMLGYSISSHGDYVAVGEPDAVIDGFREAGKVHIYKKLAGRFKEIQVLQGSDARSGTTSSEKQFGFSVSMKKNILAIGSRQSNTASYDDGHNAQGKVVIFERLGGSDSWEQTREIGPPITHAQTYSYFGQSLEFSPDGETLIVGAPEDDTVSSNHGAIFVFDRSSRYQFTHFLTSSAGTADSRLGTSISFTKTTDKIDTIAAGAYRLDSNRGKVEIFEYKYIDATTGTTWRNTQTLTALDDNVNDDFGYSVDLEGDYLVIGAPGGNSSLGSAYIFQKVDGAWEQIQKLNPKGVTGSYRIGYKVSIKNGVIYLGGYINDSDAQGAVLIYEKIGSQWVEVKTILTTDYDRITEDGTTDIEAFSIEMLPVGDLLFVGASQTTVSSNIKGSLYILEKKGKSWADVQVSYAGINLGIVEEVDIDNNIIRPLTKTTIGQLLLHRQGPYGWPTWKQLRGYQHPVARAHKKNNIYSVAYIEQYPDPLEFNRKAILMSGNSADSTYLEIDKTREIFKNKPEISLFAWVKHPQADDTESHNLFAINTGTGGNRFSFAIKGTQAYQFDAPGVLAIYQTPNIGWQMSSGVRIDDNEWHHIGFTYRQLSTTSGEIELYLDGKSQGSKITVGAFSNIVDGQNDKVSIGHEFDAALTTSDFWKGYISDFAIWDKQLTDVEVASLIRHEKPTADPQFKGLSNRFHPENKSKAGLKSFGPIDLRTHDTFNRLQVWYRMGDGSQNNLKDSIKARFLTIEDSIHKIYNNANIGSRGYYHARPTGSASNQSMTIVDVRNELPGTIMNRHAPRDQTNGKLKYRSQFGSPGHSPSMNSGYRYALDSMLRKKLTGIFDVENPYERARYLDDHGPRVEDASTGKSVYGTVSDHRSNINYKDVPVTERFNPMVMTVHSENAPLLFQDPENLRVIPGEAFQTIEDPRSPRHFASRHNIEDIDQQKRELSWNLDQAYYASFTKNVSYGQRIDLWKDNPYMTPFGQVGIRKTFQNDITTFAEMLILRDSNKEENKRNTFTPLFNNIIKKNDEGNKKLIEINYIEKIYPREVNTFTKHAREREQYDFHGWKKLRDNRNVLLSGNVNHFNDEVLLKLSTVSAFPHYTVNDENNDKKSFFGTFDALDVRQSTNTTNLPIVCNISASVWPLDSRKTFTELPVEIGQSYFNDADNFLQSRDQGTRAEGILQNDFSTFPLGYNGLYGTPPFSMVYNRRIPQTTPAGEFLAGEAMWEAASGTLGPFYDSYKDYSFGDIRLIAQDHSVIPEFRISEFVEEVLNNERTYPENDSIEDPLSYWPDFLSLTGAIHQRSSGDLDIGGQFFKTYSNSDFLKYFEVVDNEITHHQHPVTHTRLTLKCKAAMKFLPYRGFYPAERVVQICDLFHKNYLSADVLDKLAQKRNDSGIVMTTSNTRKYLNLRANASRYQVTKPLFGPGVLMNSIKAGVAVDYPIFTGSFDTVSSRLPTTASLKIFSTLDIPNNTTFTGSIINSTEDDGMPRIKSSVTRRVKFEDMLNPSNLFDENIFDNEPHPSASLQYGTSHWNRIIERPAVFGTFEKDSLLDDLGVSFENTEIGFANQISPYTRAIHNFAAETVNFFVEDGHLTTLVSKPIDEYFVSGQTHKMRVRLTNVNTVMYDRHSAFGPPVDDSGDGLQLKKLTLVSQPENASLSLTLNDPNDYSSLLSTIVDVNELPAITASSVDNSTSARKVIVKFYSAGAAWSVPPADNYSDDTTSADGPVLYVNVDTPAAGSTADERKGAMASSIKAHLDRSEAVKNYWTTSVEGDTLTITANWFGTANGVSFSTVDADTIDVLLSAPEPSIFAESSPISFSGGQEEDQATYTSTTETITSSHGFMPYVPPFLDPNSSPYVEISFTPTETKNFTAEEIIQNSTYEYYNFKATPNNAATNTNYKESMSLSASLNLGICVSLHTDSYSTTINDKSVSSILSDNRGTHPGQNFGYEDVFDLGKGKPKDRWVIQTKWETPVMDFAEAKVSALNIDDNTIQEVTGSPWKDRYWDSYYVKNAQLRESTTGSFMTGSTGMWHQKGSIIDNQNESSLVKGYFLSAEDVEGFPGLASKLGFIGNVEKTEGGSSLKLAKNFRRRVGPIENRKMVKEAVVAIPYVADPNSTRQVDFIPLDMNVFKSAQQTLKNLKHELNWMQISNQVTSLDDYRRLVARYKHKTENYVSEAPINAVEYQLHMMEQFVLPPSLDFLLTNQEPFMMYFFQFRASFDKTDISNIWQNLYPESNSAAAKARYSCVDRSFDGRITPLKDVSYVSHYLDTLPVSGRKLSPVKQTSIYDLFSPRGRLDKAKTRWLVFKVKERALTDLEAIRKRSVDPRSNNIDKFEYVKESKSSSRSAPPPKDPKFNPTYGNAGKATSDPGPDTEPRQNGIQFNWPYDYFSFVELVKLEAKIDSYTFSVPPIDNGD